MSKEALALVLLARLAGVNGKWKRSVEAIKTGFQARGIEVEAREGQDAGRAKFFAL